MARPKQNLGTTDDPRLRRVERLTEVLDNSIRIPGLGFRIGLDSIIGLIPSVGDVAGLGFSSYIVLQAALAGVSKATLLRMIANISIDAVIGAIPFLGDLFDMGWKANTRNMALLKTHYDPSLSSKGGSNKAFFALLVLILLALGGLALFLTVWLAGAILNLFGLETSGLF